MKRSIILVGAIFSFLGACCTLAVFLGRLQPAPTLFSGLSQCNQDKCLLGIVPGKTSWLSAKSHFLNLAFDSDIEVQFDPNTHIYILPSQDHGRVSEEGVTFAPGYGPTLGTLINSYGIPCLVSMNPSTSFFLLRYQS